MGQAVERLTLILPAYLAYVVYQLGSPMTPFLFALFVSASVFEFQSFATCM
jgi:hypothetical protein